MTERVKKAAERAGKYINLSNILTVAVIIQVIFIAYVNLFTMEEILDNDMAKLFVHIAEMWKQKKVLIPGWVYDTTVEIDCPAIIAVFLYGITKNIYISSGISNVIFLLLFLYIIHVLVKTAGFSVDAGKLAMLVIMIPYSFGQLLYFNMLFFGGAYYVMKVVIPLIAICLMISDDGMTRSKYVLAAILAVFLFITSFSSSIYVFVSGILPIFAVYFLIAGKSREKNIFILISFVTAAAGYLAGSLIPAEVSEVNRPLITSTEFQDSVNSFVCCFIEMMGALPNESVLPVSVQGIKCVLRALMALLLVAFIVVYSVRAVRAYLDDDNGKRATLSQYIFSLLFVDAFILIMTGLGTQIRYLLISFCAVLIIFAAEVYEKILIRKGNLIKWSIIAVVLMIMALSDLEVLRGEPYPYYRVDHLKYEALEDMLEPYADKDILFLNDVGTTEILRARNLEDSREYLTYMKGNEDFEDGIMVCDYYIDAADPSVLEKDHILITNEHFGDVSGLPEDIASKYEEIGKYQIYRLYRKLQ
ncbi:MAG: hypothetical protein K6G03_12310 [Lachnospiraceae bacterium]|nr:hypothetical protein [Lachnospiraceae bacterium]